MTFVTSKDGTRIAYDRQGGGPDVVLVGGGLDDGSENATLAAELVDHFTVYNYARRGRGDSGDTPPYAVEREIEDIEALVAEAGGSAHLYGVSSGGMFALEAAASGLAIDRLAVYEVPYDTADDAPRRYQEYRERLGAMLAGGRRGEAVELFMRLAGSSEEDIRGTRTSPYWSGLEALAMLGEGTWRPDAVLLDVMMPGLDGPGTLQALRRLPGYEALPVVFITARAQSEEQLRYLAMGAAGVITKPFNPMTLASDFRARLAGA